MRNILIKEFSETVNSSVNFEKLNVELRLASFGNYIKCYPFDGAIFVEFSSELDAPQKGKLNYFIVNHDGLPPATSEGMIKDRTLKFNQMVQMANYHPSLNEVETNGLLTLIDNYKNAFLTDGIRDNIIAKIMELGTDANSPFFAYLNTVVNNAGNKAYQYLISEIQKI